jgi:hypothetical protein
MVGPPEERMTWGENSPKALRDKNYERKTKDKHTHENTTARRQPTVSGI